MLKKSKMLSTYSNTPSRNKKLHQISARFYDFIEIQHDLVKKKPDQKMIKQSLVKTLRDPSKTEQDLIKIQKELTNK